ncbi:MAG TPA: hypothetical protein VFZ17_13320 [Acidimicrobiia bacterium]|nr:hypothetical protein [Acidimicrobiia bacterium]
MTIDKATTGTARVMLSKVPEVTVFFWIIKILATTIGETAADYLADNLGLGLTGTTWVMTAALVAVLVLQFRSPRYVPVVYWLVVVVLSIVGTLITDNLTDKYHVALETTTVAFAVCLALTFASWYRVERTLSIHSIDTPRREAFYWLAILFTFALGTASGDLIAERFDVGYWKSALLFGACIALITAAWRYLGLNPILAFWLAYILTRPLGASIGDFLSQPKADGGLALGTTTTSVIFLAAIVLVVAYLTRTKRDQPPAIIESDAGAAARGSER